MACPEDVTNWFDTVARVADGDGKLTQNSVSAAITLADRGEFTQTQGSVIITLHDRGCELLDAIEVGSVSPRSSSPNQISCDATVSIPGSSAVAVDVRYAADGVSATETVEGSGSVSSSTQLNGVSSGPTQICATAVGVAPTNSVLL